MKISDRQNISLFLTGMAMVAIIFFFSGCPHLHFAIWDSNTEHPPSGMGYDTPRSFVDPDWFFKNNLCILCATTDSGDE